MTFLRELAVVLLGFPLVLAVVYALLLAVER